MKIIEQSGAPEAWPRRFTCGDCQSLLEVSDVDVKVPGKPGATVGGWTCPVCSVVHLLNDEDTASVIASQQHRNNPVKPL
jgi:hypothetical protein